MDFSGAGDNTFPSILHLDTHTFMIANYTSTAASKKQVVDFWPSEANGDISGKVIIPA